MYQKNKLNLIKFKTKERFQAGVLPFLLNDISLIIWLGISALKKNKKELFKISLTFTNLYTAYKCKADSLYDNNDFEEALIYYLKADTAQNACDTNSEYWELELNYSFNNIENCKKRIKSY